LLASGPKPGASTNFAILAGICIACTKAKGDHEVNSVAHIALLVAVQLQPGILLDFSIIRRCFSSGHGGRAALQASFFTLKHAA
jgi:hypothetical protein